jgi:hypothetical protein
MIIARKFLIALGLIVELGICQAQNCIPNLPANLHGCGSDAYMAENPKGCWVTWKKETGKRYLAVAQAKYCNSTTARKAAYAWIRNPSVPALQFGKDPWTDPALKAVWMYSPLQAKEAGLIQ